MIMIVKACIFSPSLTRQLHYHSQLDKSVAWFWKSNEDNLLWILWMRSQFTWKWPPTLIEVVRFTYFAAQNVLLYFAAIQWETSPLNVSFSVWSGDPPGASNEQFQTNKLGSQVAWQVSGGGGGGKWLFTLLIWAPGESKLTARPGTAARLLGRPVTAAWEWLHGLSEDIFAQLFFFSLTFCGHSCHKQRILMTFMN